MTRFVPLALILIGLAGCAEDRPNDWPYGFVSRFMPEEPPELVQRQPLRFTDFGRYAVVMFMPGSTREDAKDQCTTNRAGPHVPHTIVDLAGTGVAGRTLLVYAYCTPTRIGGFNRPGSDGVPKVMRRAVEIEAMAREFVRAGLPWNRLFLAGQSAGAWASLLAMRGGQTPVAGLIGFAPAFAGLKQTRLPVWQAERDRQAALIAEAPGLDALIYHFEGDRFEPPEDMAFLATIPGIDRIVLPGDAIDGVDCGTDYPHEAVFKDCVRLTQRDRILEFIEQRLRATDAD